jgi:Phage integrase family
VAISRDGGVASQRLPAGLGVRRHRPDGRQEDQADRDDPSRTQSSGRCGEGTHSPPCPGPPAACAPDPGDGQRVDGPAPAARRRRADHARALRELRTGPCPATARRPRQQSPGWRCARQLLRHAPSVSHALQRSEPRHRAPHRPGARLRCAMPTAMVTGARRGELCALRWKHIDLSTSTLTVRKAVAQDGGSTWEKDTKTHQRRRITLDPVTVDLLGSYHQLLADELAKVDAELDDDAFLFSTDPAQETWLRPSSVSQRYRRMCAGLGWDMDIKELPPPNSLPPASTSALLPAASATVAAEPRPFASTAPGAPKPIAALQAPSPTASRLRRCARPRCPM